VLLIFSRQLTFQDGRSEERHTCCRVIHIALILFLGGILSLPHVITAKANRNYAVALIVSTTFWQLIDPAEKKLETLKTLFMCSQCDWEGTRLHASEVGKVGVGPMPRLV
jgi:hypothetical protein